MKILIAIVIFSFIILIHELGHFLFAKWNDICVEEFSLGLGPRLIGIKRGETMYSIKLLPFGGACMMRGEDEDSEEERSFGKKSVWGRISVVAAGPIFNFILAFLLAVIVISFAGYDETKVRGLMKDYPAEQAGMEEGDRIVALNGGKVLVSREITFFLNIHDGETVDVTYVRDGDKKTVALEPVYDEETGRHYIGLTGLGIREKGNPLKVIQYSIYEVRYWIKTTIQSLGMLVSGQVGVKDLSGPVGIVDVIGETYEQSKAEGTLTVVLTMLNMSILLTANLGVMNLLPLPALDGGRLVFLLIEALIKKRVPQKIEAVVHFTGLMLLMLLMVFVMFNDFQRIFGG